MLGEVYIPSSNSLTPGGCPTIQLSSDSIYLKIASDSVGQVLSPKDCLPTPHFRCQLQAQVITCVESTSYELEVLTAPSLGSINVLELFTKLREIFYLLDYWFIRNSQKRCIGQGMGKGLKASMLFLAVPLFQNLHMFANLEALQIQSSFFFKQRLHT